MMEMRLFLALLQISFYLSHSRGIGWIRGGYNNAPDEIICQADSMGGVVILDFALIQHMLS